MPQVSVIVLTYNPDNRKLRQTLTAIAAQQEIDLELIISDDGSAKKDFSFLDAFMEQVGIHNYKLLAHAENRGTVQSCLSAVEAATGQYVFLTSPGDYLFDPLALRDLYRFAQENNAPLCFGNAVFYNAETGIPKLTRTYGSPAAPQLYVPGSTRGKCAFFGGCWVIGASYFRSRELALDAFRVISQTAKFMEDTPSTAYALASGEQLCYCDRNLVWYEDGTGVSTGASEKWKKILHQDALESFRKIKALFPKDPYVDLTLCNLSQNNRLVRIAGKLFSHPILSVRAAFSKQAAKKPIHCTAADLQRLEALLKTE